MFDLHETTLRGPSALADILVRLVYNSIC